MFDVAEVCLRLDLQTALVRLTERQRLVLLLTVEGYTQAEIAAGLGIAQPVVCLHLGAARANLRKSLEEYL